MWQRFTERARRVILLGQEEAGKMSSGHVGTEHLLLGLLREDEGAGAHVLRELGIAMDAVRLKVVAHSELLVEDEAVFKRVWRGREPEPKLTSKAKRVLELAADEARRMRHNYIGTEHLLLALLREKDGLAARILGEMGLEIEKTRLEVLDYLGPSAPQASPEAGAPPVEEKWQQASDRIIVRVLEQLLADENMAQKILVASGLDIVAARERVQKFLRQDERGA